MLFRSRHINPRANRIAEIERALRLAARDKMGIKNPHPDPTNRAAPRRLARQGEALGSGQKGAGLTVAMPLRGGVT